MTLPAEQGAELVGTLDATGRLTLPPHVFNHYLRTPHATTCRWDDVADVLRIRWADADDPNASRAVVSRDEVACWFALWRAGIDLAAAPYTCPIELVDGAVVVHLAPARGVQ